MFVGKLIVSKGVDLLLAAWPLVLAARASSAAVVVGFGAFRDGLERLAARWPPATSTPRARSRRGRAPRAARARRCATCSRSSTPWRPERGLRAAARRCATAWCSTGRLEHDELAPLLPAAEAMAVPEHVPRGVRDGRRRGGRLRRAAGRAAHSGLAEVARTLAAAVPSRPAPGCRSARADDAVTRARRALSAWLAAPEDIRTATREAIVAAARDRYSWEGVAEGVIAAAQGRLDVLAPVR